MINTEEAVSISVLVLSVVLLLLHFYLLFLKDKITEKLKNKKLTQAQRRLDQEKLDIVLKALTADDDLVNKIKSYENTKSSKTSEGMVRL